MKQYLLDSYDGDSILLIDDMSDGAYSTIEYLIGKIKENKEPNTLRMGYKYYLEFPSFLTQLVLEQLHIMDFKRILKNHDNWNSAFT
jgi:hypothetical protein